MRAVYLAELSGPAGVRLAEVDEPTPGMTDVLVDVHAAGVIFPDLLLSRGAYQRKVPLPFTPGGEVAGIVRAAPDGAQVKAGDRVAAILPDFGGFADSVTVPQEFVFPLPDGVDFGIAAAVPVNYLTMHLAFRRRTKLQPGETVLVHGAAGGVGIAAIQLARAWGAQVIAVASTLAKQEVARAAGAHHVVAVDCFRDAVRHIVPDGVDLVVDPVGGDRLLDSLRVLGNEGRLLVVGFAAGSIPALKVNRLLMRNQSLIGVNLGVSSDGVSVRMESDLHHHWLELVPLLANGSIKPFIGREMPLESAAEALAVLERRQALGKIVLRVR